MGSGYLEALDAIMKLVLECPLKALNHIDHIRSLHWTLHQDFWEGLNTLEQWAVEIYRAA